MYISPKKTQKWPINTWKGVQGHLLVISEMQIKATLWYHDILTSLATIKQSKNKMQKITSADNDVAKSESFHIAGRNEKIV